MNSKQQSFLKQLSELPSRYLDVISSAQEEVLEFQTDDEQDQQSKDITFKDQIKAVIRAFDKPLHAREIKAALSLQGINTTSVDTLCGRMRRNGELLFFADDENSIRGKYGLLGQTIQPKLESSLSLLIQDLANEQEIIRFNKYNIYRRPSPPTNAKFFSPYFTRNSGRPEGISCISKIMGVLHFHPAHWEAFQDQIRTFAPTKEVYDNWIAGLQYALENGRDDAHTHYFLCPLCVRFEEPVLKDPGRTEGAGVDWISLMIPANRVVSLDALFARVPFFPQGGNGAR